MNPNRFKWTGRIAIAGPISKYHDFIFQNKNGIIGGFKQLLIEGFAGAQLLLGNAALGNVLDGFVISSSRLKGTFFINISNAYNNLGFLQLSSDGLHRFDISPLPGIFFGRS
jgi:hypothetical protein